MMLSMTLRGFLIGFVLFPAVLFGQPKLKVLTGYNIDYGTIYSNQLMQREIPIKNIGTDTLIISAPSSSCGCTIALLSSDHIPPDSSSKISVHFDPERFSGKVSKAISFETNDPAMPHAHIDFNVEISKVIIVSEDYITFPDAIADSTTQTTYTLKNVTDRPIKLLSILSTSPLLSPESDKKEIKPQETATITCTFKASQRGYEKGNINIDTDNPNVAHISTRFWALVKSKKPASAPANK